MRRGDRAGWTSFDASLARPAAISRRFVRRQFERSQNLRQEKPRSQFLVDQHCALAMPADAGLSRVIAL